MRVLIIEDDQDTRSYIKTRLEEKGFAVDEAVNGREGLYAAKAHPYDAILLDYELPEKNGFEVCKELRHSRIHTPIIMISVADEVTMKVDGFSLGIDDYITKPFFFDELYARIQAVMRRPALRTSPVLECGDLIIDINKQKVTRGKDPIYLTKKEFALVEFMARTPGEVISRSKMVEHVWDSDIDPFSNTIETHILNLRKKIDGGRKKKLIHSVAGRGYKLDEDK